MPALSDAEATAIALQWMARAVERSGNFVRFMGIHTAARLPALDVTVVSSYVEENETLEDLAINVQGLTALREMLGVWRVLASCRGFRGNENLRFWDQVVRQCVRAHGELAERSRRELIEGEVVSDHLMFNLSLEAIVNADENNKQVLQEWMHDVCRELFQLGRDSETIVPLTAEYQDTVRQLQPFIDEDQLARGIIAVDLAFNAHLEENELTGDPDFLQAYSSILKEIATNFPDDMCAYAPLLHIEKGGFRAVSVTMKRELEVLTSVIASSPFPMGNTCPQFGLDIDSVAFSEFVTTAMQIRELSAKRVLLDGYQRTLSGKLEALMYILPDDSRFPLVSLFSALPHAQSLQALQMMGMGIHWPWTEFECSWLAYACLHPRSKSSSWNGLWLGPAVLTSSARQLLRSVGEDPVKALSVTHLAVVTGAVLPFEVRDGDRLQIVTMNEGTTLYAGPSVFFNRIITLACEAEFEMCDLVNEDWHCVLVPGYGFGWVQASSVAQTNEWIPKTPIISSLKKLDAPPTFSVDDVLLLLSVLGSAIETLTLRKNCVSARTLDKLGSYCPNLKSLTLGAQAEQLIQNSLKRLFLNDSSVLESLVVEWDKCNTPVLLKILTNWKDKAAVKRLKRLHLTKVEDASKCNAADMAALDAMLRANRSLEEFFMYADELSPGWDMRASGVALEAHNGEVLHRNEYLAQRLAFLSIMKSLRNEVQESSLRQVDVAVLSAIFEFAEPPVRRIVHLSPIKRDW